MLDQVFAARICKAHGAKYTVKGKRFFFHLEFFGKDTDFFQMIDIKNLHQLWTELGY